MLVVGIDVGGTHTKFGLVENGVVIKTMELGTNTFDVVRQICNGSREIVQSSDKKWEDVDGIAVGFPGMVINSVVLDSPNISLQNVNLKEILEEELDKLVVVKNDAEMATIAEHKVGGGADCENMVLITLGTGIGGGIIVGHKLYVGNGGAGELGHIIFERNGKQCGCGRKGCAEQYLSMIALDNMAKDIMVGYPNTCITFSGDGSVYASELIRAYKRNDSAAIAIVDKYVDMITQYILDLCNMFRPNRIVIGGGITHAPEIIDMIARNCRRLEYGYKNSPKVDVVPAQLGNHAGVVGGYVCVEEELNASGLDNNVEETTGLNNGSMSLLDSISLQLDKDDANQVGAEEQVEVTENVANEKLVSQALKDIKNQINFIKNEQLLGGLEEDDIDDKFASNTPDNSNMLEDEEVDSSQIEGYNNSHSTYEEHNEGNGIDNIQIDNNVNNFDIGDNNATDVDYDNSEMFDEDDNSISLGLNEIFFGKEVNEALEKESELQNSKDNSAVSEDVLSENNSNGNE